ncbi:MAG TPA: hypothetical protein PLQ54_19575, partial [Armatimonadota bacterium]|nr:hypothetical protein [Armatimonadota bacterium]
APYPGEEGSTTNDYVSNYRDMRLKTKDVGGAFTALMFQDLPVYSAHEGCLRVEDGSADDGNQWWTVWPFAAHGTAKDLLIWFVETRGHPQRWFVNGSGFQPGTVDIPKDLIYPCPKILGGPN